jgi:hypothetical protein
MIAIYGEGNTMERPSNITDTHVERGIQMRAIVRHDIVARGMSFESAVASLAEYLGIDAQAVALAIAIANEWEGA